MRICWLPNCQSSVTGNSPYGISFCAFIFGNVIFGTGNVILALCYHTGRLALQVLHSKRNVQFQYQNICELVTDNGREYWYCHLADYRTSNLSKCHDIITGMVIWPITIPVIF